LQQAGGQVSPPIVLLLPHLLGSNLRRIAHPCASLGYVISYWRLRMARDSFVWLLGKLYNTEEIAVGVL
jgi:hypothetical protein